MPPASAWPDRCRAACASVGSGLLSWGLCARWARIGSSSLPQTLVLERDRCHATAWGRNRRGWDEIVVTQPPRDAIGVAGTRSLSCNRHTHQTTFQCATHHGVKLWIFGTTAKDLGVELRGPNLNAKQKLHMKLHMRMNTLIVSHKKHVKLQRNTTPIKLQESTFKISTVK